MNHKKAPTPTPIPTPAMDEYMQREAETVARIQHAEATAADRMPIQEELVNTDGVAPINLYKEDPSSDIEDLVDVGGNDQHKTFHRPNGEFMSRYELEQIQSHQDLIRGDSAEKPEDPTESDSLPIDPKIPRGIGNRAVAYYSGPPKPKFSFGIRSNGPRTDVPGKQTWEDIQAKRKGPRPPLQTPIVGDALTPGHRRHRKSAEKTSVKEAKQRLEKSTEQKLDQELADVLEVMKEEGTRGDRIIEVLEPRTSYRKGQRASRARNAEDSFVYYPALQRPRPDRESRKFIHKLIPNRVGNDAIDYTDGWVIPNNILDLEVARTQRDEEFSHHNSFVVVPLEDPEGNITLDFFRRYSWVEQIDGKSRGVAVLDKEACTFHDLPINLRRQVVEYIQAQQERDRT